MPICFIEGPSEVPSEKRRSLIARATEAIHAAYPMGDTRVLIRSNDPGSVGQDGALGEAFRPTCFLEVPQGLPDARKTTLIQALTAAIEGALGASEALVFFREYPLNMVGTRAGLHADNPAITALMGSSPGVR